MLTDEEKRMLQGEYGPLKQKALSFIIRYGEVLGASELCKVSRATLFIGAHHYLDCFETDDYEEIFSTFYLNSEENIPITPFSEECISQTCATVCDVSDYKTTHQSKSFFDRNKRFLEITKNAGVSIVNSCTPYYVGWIPLMGEHFVTTESSNTLMSNSLFGAYGNSDGVEAAVCSAICGRTPRWGNHIRENRNGTVLFSLNCQSKTVHDWDLIGYTIGRLLPHHEKPIIDGYANRPTIHSLRQCFSSLATTSAAEICHVVRITPEARSLEEALGGTLPKSKIVITQKDIEESYRMICDPGNGDIDYVSIGCPHLALDELRVIASYLESKKVKEGVELLIWTDYATKEMANVNGYTAVIESTGAHLLTSSCPLVMREESHKHAKAMVINGAKQAHSLRGQTSSPIYYGDVFQCIDAAICGRWEARNG